MSQSEIIQTGVKSLQVTVMSLIIGVIGFIVAGAVVTSTMGSEFAELDQEIIWLIAGGIALIAIIFGFSGNLLFKKKLSEISASKDYKDILAQYRSALIIRVVMSEMPGFLSCVSFFILADYTLLAGAVISIIAMGMAFPKKEMVYRQLGINEWEV